MEAGQEILYHYTDARGLLGIVQSGQLWASNAAFLNDSTEVVYMRDVLADVAQEFRKKYQVDAEIRDYAADAYAGTGRFSDAQRRTASMISILEMAPTFPGGLFDVYVSCFCSNGDLLSHWRGYPSTGGGYAVGLRSESLPQGGGLLRRVVYDEQAQRQLLRDLLAPVIDRVASPDFATADDRNDPWDRLIREHLGPVISSLVECGFCFKHPGFKEEAEWRLVILRSRDPKYRQNDAPPLIRPTPTGLLPYLERSLESGAVAKVVVGPGSQPTLAADAAVQLLSNAGYENARELVTHSTIPLRV